MAGNKRDTHGALVDLDVVPEKTDEWFEKADRYVNGVLVKRGRRPLENPKKAISLRVDADVLDRFKAVGPGWQGRMNDALRKAVGL